MVTTKGPKGAKAAKGTKSAKAIKGNKGAKSVEGTKGVNPEVLTAVGRRDPTDRTAKAVLSRAVRKNPTKSPAADVERNRIGKSTDHLDPDYKARGRRRAKSPTEDIDPTYKGSSERGNSTHCPPLRTSPPKVDRLGFIDPSYIDEDAKEENGEGDEVDIIGGIRITASSHSPNSRTVSSPAMLSVRRFIARTEGSPLMGLTGLATDAYNCLMAPRQSNVDPEHVPPVAAAAASVSALGNTDYYEEGDEVSR